MRAQIIGLLLVAGVSFPAAGQQTPAALPFTTAPAASWQASVAIHPKNTQNMVVAVSPGTVYYTLDGGTTWKPGTVATTGTEGEVSLLSDGHGTFYYFHNAAGQPMCYTSRDGQVWDAGAPVTSDASKKNVRLGVTADAKGSLSVTYTQFDQYPSDDAACRSSIWMTKSSNGKKWSTPKEMSQTAGRCSDAQHAASGSLAGVSPDGKSYVVWLTGQTLFMDRSFDGSMWLSNDITITRMKADPSYSEPTLLVDRAKGPRTGSLYITWSDNRSGQGDADVWLIRSTNYGDNWTSPIRINDDAIGQQYQPATAIDPATGIMYVLYFDRRASEGEGLSTEVYLAWSNDGGNSFHNKKISTAPFTGQATLPERGYTGLAVHKGVIAAVWIQDVDGKPAVFTATTTQETLGAKQIATK
jgi:hypothetical protein